MRGGAASCTLIPRGCLFRKVGEADSGAIHDVGERQPLGWRSDGNSEALYACQIHPQNDCCAQPLPNRQPVGGADDGRAASRLLTGWGRHTDVSRGSDRSPETHHAPPSRQKHFNEPTGNTPTNHHQVRQTKKEGTNKNCGEKTPTDKFRRAFK